MRNLRYAFRLLRKSPGLSLVAILSLALGIGANTTIFSLANTLLSHPPGVGEPDRVVEVWTHDPSPGAPTGGLWGFSYLDYLEYTARMHSLSGMALYNGFVQTRLQSGAGAAPAAWTGQLVTANYFEVLGMHPVLGRWFAPAEGAVKGAGQVVVLSYAAWQRRFGGDRGVIGRQIGMNAEPFTVIGVAPRGFQGMITGVDTQFWAPLTMAERLGAPGMLEDRGNRGQLAIARLRPGVTMAAASAEMDLIQRGLDQRFPHWDSANWGGEVLPIGAVPTPARVYVGVGAGLLGAVVGLVLLIACANAALVLLVEALGRRQEFAVRSALGASRGQLLRQGLVHSLLLALLAGGLGLVLARVLGPLLLRLRPPGLPFALNPQLDLRVLLFTLAVALATGIVFGLAPAWQGTRASLAADLKDGTPGAGGTRARLRNAFIVAQVAMCVVVLLGAALCLRSLSHARAIDPGFDVAHLLAVQLDPQSLGYSGAAAHQFLERERAAAAGLAGVEGASFTSIMPMQGNVSLTDVLRPGMTPPSHEEGYAVDTSDVGAGYFAASGTRLLRGRDFSPADLTPGHPALVVVNLALAQKFWSHGDALG